MFPPLFEVCSADAQVQSTFGTNPCRVYPFGEAPQQGVTPYVAWRVFGGEPENNLSCPPDMDRFMVEVSVYADQGQEARDGAVAIRDAVEPLAHVTAWAGEGRDETTRLYRVRFLVEWFTERDVSST